MNNNNYYYILLIIPVLILVKIYFSGWTGLFVSQVFNNQQGKVILITGGSEGIGFETVRFLARNGASTIIMASRSEEKGLAAIMSLKKELTKSKIEVGVIEFMKLDLNDYNSVQAFLVEFEQKYKGIAIDTLINNAGIFRGAGASKQGYEKIVSTNCHAPWFLTTSLLHLMRDHPESRIINLSSLAHEGALGYSFATSNIYFEKLSYQVSSESQNYNVSKLGNILFTKQLQVYLESTGSPIQVYSLHPGVVRTALFNDLFKSMIMKILLVPLYPFIWLLTKSVYHGALTTINLATLPTKELVNGGYYRDCLLYKSTRESHDQASQRAMWNKSVLLFQTEGFKVAVPPTEAFKIEPQTEGLLVAVTHQ